MNYNDAYTKIYRELLQTEGVFSMRSVMVTAFLNSPEDFTKKQIKELGLQVLDDSLNNSMILMVRDGVYVSILSKEAQNLKSVVKYGVSHDWKDTDPISKNLKASIFNDKSVDEEVLGK